MSPVAAAVARATTALFVPGSRPDRFARACAAGADCVLLDLEDAVAPQAKGDALAHVLRFLDEKAPGRPPVLVRVNPAGSSWAAAEIEALAGLVSRRPYALAGLVVPKAESPRDLADLSAALRGTSGTTLLLVALVETARGVLAAAAIAKAPAVTRLAFGALDFALDVGAQPGSAVLSAARAAVVIGSAAAGKAPPWDSPSTAIDDLDEVRREALQAQQEGFGGKLCIHPAQLAPVRAAFGPQADEVDWARRVLAAGDKAAGGVVRVDGRMVDRPLLERARVVLERAGGEVA